MDRVLFSCDRFADLPALLALAESSGAGLELQEFGHAPDLLDGSWNGHVQRYRKALAGFSGELALHGAYLDLYPGSPDRRVADLARERFRANLLIAAELGAHVLDFHANYLPMVHDQRYLPAWLERQVAFWRELVEEAGQLGVTMVVENMWEPEPNILKRIVQEVGSPFLQACLDIGHVSVFSRLRVADWVDALAPFLFYVHLHNTDGQRDIHLPLDTGVLDISSILARLRSLPAPPIFCLELHTLSDIKASLPFLDLARSLPV